MKILQVIPYFCFGGAETMCENLTYGLLALGHDVTVVSLYDEKTPIARRMERLGVHLIYLNKKPGLDLSMVWKLRGIMGRIRPDVVHSHLNIIKYAVAAARLAGNIPCVHTVHNVALEEAESRLEKTINDFYYRRGWSVPVALSPLVRKSITELYGLPEAQVPMVCNGVDLSRCQPKESYSQTPGKLLHIGRFQPQKNHEGLLRGFALLAKRHPQATLTLLGDGELEGEMKALTESLGIGDRVRFLGNQSDVYGYYREADVFVLPSHFEGMPMSVIEAMGTGLPIVAARVGGLSDMLRQGVSGLLLDAPVTAEAFAETVGSLLDDPQRCEALGKNAREESEQFSAQTMAEAYCRIYQSVAAK